MLKILMQTFDYTEVVGGQKRTLLSMGVGVNNVVLDDWNWNWILKILWLLVCRIAA